MLYTFYPLIAALLSNILAQLFKPVSKYLKTGKWDFYQILAAGGFPSSHTSTMAGLTVSLGFKDGFDSSTFFIALILTGIIMYDAMNVRLYAGKHIALTQKLINDLKDLQTLKLDDPIYLTRLKDILGHERIEVFGGLVLGAFVALVLNILLTGGL